MASQTVYGVEGVGLPELAQFGVVQGGFSG